MALELPRRAILARLSDTSGESPELPTLAEALAAAGKPSEIHVYEGAPHGFHADYRPSYRADVAQDGWVRLQAWFKRYGAA
jgi:carboxymethylenebutenolidase